MLPSANTNTLACVLREVPTVHTAEYKPILEAIERILAEVGLDEEVCSPR